MKIVGYGAQGVPKGLSYTEASAAELRKREGSKRP